MDGEGCVELCMGVSMDEAIDLGSDCPGVRVRVSIVVRHWTGVGSSENWGNGLHFGWTCATFVRGTAADLDHRYVRVTQVSAQLKLEHNARATTCITIPIHPIQPDD